MKKNGFTLIELLGVIVILGIIITITITKVVPIMNRSKSKAFINDAIIFSEAGRNKYSDNKMNQVDTGNLFSGTSNVNTKCYSIESSLIGPYASTGNDNIVGSVEVCATSACNFTSKIWVSNGKYNIAGVEYENLKSLNKSVLESTTYSENFLTCGVDIS